jgi:predicted nucleic acid-binding protein
LRYLLDVNVWIALLDESHVFNQNVTQFFETPNIQIASCPIIENGVIRILNLPNYSKFGPVGFDVVVKKLAEIYADKDVEFWADDYSLVTGDLVTWSRVFSHSQITDLYLLGLAVQRNCTLVTLDQRISPESVKGAKDQNLRLL